jgi:hypothetical protein
VRSPGCSWRHEQALQLLDSIDVDLGSTEPLAEAIDAAIGAVIMNTLVPVDAFGLQLTVERAQLLHTAHR